jgi:serine/threonine protein kinase
MPDESPRRSKHFGEFELLEKVGQGGMSSVYKARDMRSDAIVAIKIASRLVINDRHLSRRFELEYDIAHGLDHPHLVKVISNGKQEKVPYLVMEYVDGQSLSQHLQGRERLTENDALAIFMPIAEAVSYLHSKHIIHRDIKPANILMNSKGVPKLADLGLVKNLESLSRLTRSNIGLGTMQFVSPEQFDDARSADFRSDIYSLGATLYLMLTGEYPFGKGTTLNIVNRKLKNRFDPPIEKLPQLRPCVDVAIRRSLQAERETRPASISEFVAMLAGDGKMPFIESSNIVPASAPKSVTLHKGGKERRRRERYAVELEATCRPIINPTGKRWPAWIVDVSATGLCLRAQRRFEFGSVLEILFTLRADSNTVNSVASVRWAMATEDKSWLLGCEFVKAISDDELNAICAEGMDRTNMG